MFAVMFANFAGLFASTVWAEHYAPRQPTPVAPFPIHFKGGLVVFVPSWLAAYEQWGFWLQFVVVGAIAAKFWWYQRTGQTIRV
jgi:hypothetical protein